MIPLHDDVPTRRPPFVTVSLIIACALVFLWQQTLSRGEEIDAVLEYGVIPAVLFHHAKLAARLQVIAPELTVLTSMFLHGGWLHLGGNMLFLWIFGNNVEDAMGHVRFVVFYLLCGTAAALFQGWQDPTSQTPMIGASGAIAGVLGAYLLLHPRARVLVLILLGFFTQVLRVPAWIVLGIWLLLQFFMGAAATPGEGGVAYWAHVGGFLAGLVLLLPFKRRGVRLFGGGAAQGPWGGRR